MHPEALAKPIVIKQGTSQTCGGGVYVVIIHVTCSAGACVRGYCASSVLISLDELALMDVDITCCT